MLTARLREACWPGSDDGTDALLRAWLRLGGPRADVLRTVGCTCHTGRCRVCN